MFNYSLLDPRTYLQLMRVLLRTIYHFYEIYSRTTLLLLSVSVQLDAFNICIGSKEMHTDYSIPEFTNYIGIIREIFGMLKDYLYLDGALG